MKKSILIVDDDFDIRDAVSAALTDAGYEAITAGHGLEALNLLKARAGAVDLVILDLMMPVMDAWGFREQQLRDPELLLVPVLILSAGGQVEKKAQNLGAAGWLRKPVSLEALLSSVGTLVRKGRPRAEDRVVP